MDLEVLNKLESIEKMLMEQNMLKKDVLNFNEAAIYLEVSHSHLYKLTSTAIIPFYKPNGKKLSSTVASSTNGYYRNARLHTLKLKSRLASSNLNQGGDSHGRNN